MHSCTRVVAASIFMLMATSLAEAQGSRIHLAAKGGATIENSEDGLNGTVPALGLTGALTLSPRWRGEFEFWLPGYLTDSRGEPMHRDVLYSVSAVRLFRDDGIRPFVLAGLSLARTEDRLTLCSTGLALVSCDDPDVIDMRSEKHFGSGSYLLAGGGLEIPIGRRVNIVADVRLSLAAASVLVRPGLGVSIGF